MKHIEFKRLDHILITIPEGTKQLGLKFYKEILNIEEIPGNHPRGALWFKMGDVQLHVREENGVNYSDRHPAFEVTNLEAAKDFLKAASIEIAYSSEIDGRERCFFRDPFGNRFELIAFTAGNTN
jgi:catechol 2,3-dioxygenase-like lactoylglutathione lyase family enzyme